MEKRCSNCGYLNTDAKYNKIKQPDGSILDMTKLRIRCYRADAPDVELCPECKAVL